MFLEMGKLSGLILGAIAGDCLGIPYIYMKADALFDLGRQVAWKIGIPGETTHILATALETIRLKGVNYNALAHSYWQWAMSGYDPGYVMSICFEGKKLSAVQQRARALASEHGKMCTNQLLTRQIPLVCAGLHWNTDKLMYHVYDECTLTHTDEESICYAQLYAVCLQDILLGKSRIEIWDHLFEIVKHREAYRTLLSSYYEKPSCDGSDYSQARTAFGLAMYHFWHNTPLPVALRSAVLSGGACDVNAACVGAILGAWHGIGDIPSHWQDMLLNNPEIPFSDIITRAIKDAQALATHTESAPERLNKKQCGSSRIGARPSPKEIRAPYAQRA